MEGIYKIYRVVICPSGFVTNLQKILNDVKINFKIVF